jgi:uncharacterized coiled-coil protein SlyX
MQTSAAHVARQSHEAVAEEQPSLSQYIQPSNAATPNRVTSALLGLPASSPVAKSSLHQQHTVNTPRTQNMDSSFEGFLNLTQNDQTGSPLEPRGAKRDVPLHISLASEHADLLLKFKDLSRRHAQTQSELEAMKSSTPLSTTAVLSDMYTDLQKSYEELEASYRRELEANEPFRAKIRELQLELQASNDRTAALRQDYRVQHSKITDLEVRFHLQSESLADVTDQCTALQKQLSESAQALSAAHSELRDSQTRAHLLSCDLADAEAASHDLSQQASPAPSLLCSLVCSLLSSLFSSFLCSLLSSLFSSLFMRRDLYACFNVF